MASAARNLTPLALELGGKSPNIVFPDADLDAAAAMAAMTRYSPAVGPGMRTADPALRARRGLRRRGRQAASRSRRPSDVGDPLDPETFDGSSRDRGGHGPDPRGDRHAPATKGPRCWPAGHASGGDLADGWFVAPTVFGDVDHDSELARNEVFGPVQAVLRFNSRGGGVGQGQRQRVRTGRLHPHPRRTVASSGSSRGLEAGTVIVNGMGRCHPTTPFGGYKQSGFGREGGRAGIEEMVHLKTVFVPSQSVACDQVAGTAPATEVDTSVG